MKKNQKLKFVFLLTSILIITIVIACTKEEISQTKQPDYKVTEYGKTIPVGLTIEGKKALVSFMLSAQFYSIDLSDDAHTSDIELVKNAIKNNVPLRVYLKENTNEIVKLELVSQKEAEYFKNIFVKPSKPNDKSANVTAGLDPTLPNENMVKYFFSKIRKCQFVFPGGKFKSNVCPNFNYPIDGCYARAHKIRQFLAAQGYDSQKQFVYGTLTANSAGCCLSWSYHVGVLVNFKTQSGAIEERIIDPSLFDEPVLPSTWRDACITSSCRNGNISSFATVGGDIYYRSAAGYVTRDNNYVNTDCVLAHFSQYNGCSPNPARQPYGCTY